MNIAHYHHHQQQQQRVALHIIWAHTVVAVNGDKLVKLING